MMSMTETWMGGRPQSDRNLYGSSDSSVSAARPAVALAEVEVDIHQHNNKTAMRSSLGQLIERSISAPPSSDSQDESSHAYLMRGTMWAANDSPLPTSTSTATSAYDSQAPTPVVQNGRGLEGLDNHPFGGALLIQEKMDNSGRATAPSSYWDSNGNADTVMNSSGRRSAEPSSRSSLRFGQEEEDSYLPGSSLLGNSLGLGLQRSHSAAPSFASTTSGVASPTNSSSLGPPPGLPRLVEQIPRPSSAGIVDKSPYAPRNHSGSSTSVNQGALRPAAKTLMDLIQEDIPAEENDTLSPVHYQTGVVHQTQQSAQPYFGNGMQGQQTQSLHSPYNPDPSVYTMAQSQQQQQMFSGNMDNLNYGMQNMSMKSPSIAGQLYSERQHLAQRFVNAPFDGNNSEDAYVGASVNHMRQAPQAIPLRHAPQARLTLQSQPQDAERLYYTAQAQAPQPTPQPQTMNVQGTRLQAQMLPNGQTIYVQAAPQTNQGMNYTPAIPFNAGAPTASSSAQLYQRSDGQYMSVVPVHAAPTGPMTFWQADGTTGQAVLVSGPTGGGLAAGIPHALVAARDVVSPGHHGRHAKGGGGGGGGSSSGGRQRRNERHPARRSDGKSSGTTIPMASPILEEFRSNKNRQWTIAHIEGHVVEFCQDQNGSRFIQQRLEMGDLTEQSIVIREVLPSIRRLRNDVFGNYVVQKLLDFGTAEVRANIRDTLEGEMIQLSLQMYGCRVVQKALETLAEEDLQRMMKEFHHNVLSCIYDQNGNHVIQKCIEVMSKRAKRADAEGDAEHALYLRGEIKFVVHDVLVNAASLSCHPYGCRVLQRILEHCDEETKNKVLDEVKSSHKRLLDDQYGNYVIQHVLQFGRTSDRDSILGIVVMTGLLGLSRQKFASNVVEKLLKYGNASHRRAIAAEMLKKCTDVSIANQSPTGTSVVLLMVRDAYANYVVQTTLDVVPESEEKRLLLNELKSHSEELKNYTFAKHIVSKLATLTV